MKKAIIAIIATAFLGSVTLVSTPASAYFWVPMVMKAKADKGAMAKPAKKSSKKMMKKKKM